MNIPKDPLRIRVRLDWAPSGHPKGKPRLPVAATVSDRETALLADVRLQRELGAEDYRLCRLREEGRSWAEIARIMETLAGGSWSPQRAANRVRRARQHYAAALERLFESENGSPSAGPGGSRS